MPVESHVECTPAGLFLAHHFTLALPLQDWNRVVCRDYRLTWAAVFLAFEVAQADRSLFRGWNVSWTLRCSY